MVCEKLRGRLKGRVPAHPHLTVKMKPEERRWFFFLSIVNQQAR